MEDPNQNGHLHLGNVLIASSLTAGLREIRARKGNQTPTTHWEWRALDSEKHKVRAWLARALNSATTTTEPMMINKCLRERCQAETATLLERQGVIAQNDKCNMEVGIKGFFFFGPQTSSKARKERTARRFGCLMDV